MIYLDSQLPSNKVGQRQPPNLELLLFHTAFSRILHAHLILGPFEEEGWRLRGSKGLFVCCCLFLRITIIIVYTDNVFYECIKDVYTSGSQRITLYSQVYPSTFMLVLRIKLRWSDLKDKHCIGWVILLVTRFKYLEFLFLFLFLEGGSQNRVSLCRLGCPGTHSVNRLASNSWSANLCLLSFGLQGMCQGMGTGGKDIGNTVGGGWGD